MNDYYILTDYIIDFDGLSSMLETVPDTVVKTYRSSDCIQVFYDGAHIDFVFLPLSLFECNIDKEFINKHKIQTIILISCHTSNLPQLSNLLDILSFSKHGWFGSDSDGFEPYISL